MSDPIAVQVPSPTSVRVAVPSPTSASLTLTPGGSDDLTLETAQAPTIEISQPSIEVVVPSVLGIAGPQGPQGATGAEGPQGPEGQQGPQFEPYVYVTPSPISISPTIAHGRGRYPQVTLIDSDTGQQVPVFDCLFPTVDTAIIVLLSPRTFTATFS